MNSQDAGTSLNWAGFKRHLDVDNWGVVIDLVMVCCSVIYTLPYGGTLQGALIRKLKMYYEFISLGCGKCDATPPNCFSQNTTAHTNF